MLESAYNYSVSDPVLNEDTLDQFHRLIRQHAVVELVGRRIHLRPEAEGANGLKKGISADRENFSLEEAERLCSSLSKTDSKNLERITNRKIESQEEEAGAIVQLKLNIPLNGRLLEFHQALQVQPKTEMKVVLEAKKLLRTEVVRSAGWPLCCFWRCKPCGRPVCGYHP